MLQIFNYLYKFITAYAVVVIALYMLSRVVPKAAFAARALASYLSLLICAAVGAVASIFLSLVGLKGISQWFTGRCFKYAMQLSTGITFDIQDPNNVLGTTRPAIFIGNHQTELDVLMLGCLFPKYCSVTAKSSLKRVPFLGWFMSLSGSVFIDRKNSKNSREAMAGAASEIKTRKQSVYMFPEGTRSYAKDPELLPFKKGAFHLAVQAGVPIVPCVVANYSYVLWPKGWVFSSGSIPVKVLDPIPTDGLTSADVDELTRKTRDLMMAELVSLSEKAHGRPMAVPATSEEAKVVKASGAETTADGM